MKHCRDLTEDEVIVLENENPPSTNCKGEGGMAGGVEIKSQKDRLDCSENNVSVSTSSQDEGTSGVEVKPEKDRLDCSASYILVSCHLEMLRHSLSDNLHLTQVSLPSFSLVFIASSPVGCHILVIRKQEFCKHKRLSSCGTAW